MVQRALVVFLSAQTECTAVILHPARLVPGEVPSSIFIPDAVAKAKLKAAEKATKASMGLASKKDKKEKKEKKKKKDKKKRKNKKDD